MKTELVYLTDSYLKTLEANVLEIEVVNPKLVKLVLDQTIFFAEGGGQPSDQGRIIINEIPFKVTQVRLEGEDIKHYVAVTDEMPVKGKCFLEIDWERRFKNMQVHTAGHIIDWAISELNLHNDKIIPSKGNHGKKASIVYLGKADQIKKSDIQKRVNSIIENNLKIKTEFVNFDELQKRALYIFPNLPKNKPLRIVELEGYKAVPDGGTLLKKSGELGVVIINEVSIQNDSTSIDYEVEIVKKSTKSSKAPIADTEKLIKKLNEVKEKFDKQISKVATREMIEQLRIEFMGRKSELIAILRNLKDLAYDERAKVGEQANTIKEEIAQKLEGKDEELKQKNLNQAISSEWIDVTEPGVEPKVGHVHPITQMLWKATEIFQDMGFEIVEPPEVDSDYNHFTALNIPESHPARDMWDTFWTEDGQIAIAHTSTMQHRILKTLEPPIRAIVPGKCFRNEATDARHEHTFYQVEGIYVDKGINLTHLISTLKTFLERFTARPTQIKIQPSYFPFVEPGLEVLVECPNCHNDETKKLTCSVCSKSGWLEWLGCGMIHRNVIKEAGLDPDIYTGFAWGFGLDRLVMQKYGIEDIRHFHGGDLRFLKQF